MNGGFSTAVDSVEGSFSDREGLRYENGEIFSTGGEFAHQRFNLVFFEAVQGLEVRGFDPLTIDSEKFVPLFQGPAGDFGMEALSPPDQGGEQVEPFRFSKLGFDPLDNVGRILADGGFPGVRIMLDPKLGIKEAKKLVELRYRSHGGFTTSAGGPLFDGDGGRKSGDGIHVRFFKLLHKLAGVGVQAVEITALTFGKEEIEREGTFTGAGKSGDDDHLVLGNLEIEIFQVVMPSSTDGNAERGACIFLWKGFTEAAGFGRS